MSSLDAVFVDREMELSVLEGAWSRGGFSLVIVYGRRRVGKTRLLREFCSRGRDCVFYVGVPGPEEVLRDELIHAIESSAGVRVTGRDVPEVLASLSRELKFSGRRVALVLDEFQYLAMSVDGLLEKLQRVIDEVLSRDGTLFIVLCGSAVSFMESEVLGYKSPIYGRRTCSLRLRPLRPFQVAGFYPGWELTEVIEAYGVLGGTPAYHRFFDPGKDLMENVRAYVLTPGTYLYDEAMNLLRQEVREPRTYFSILSGIASGKLAPSELANVSHVDPRTISKYVSILEDLDVVRRLAPAGRSKPVQVRFADNYFRFWFTYVKPYQGLLEAGMNEEVLKIIKETWPQYMGQVFEDAVLDSIPDLIRAGIIKPAPKNYGRWWHKGEEIDLVVWDGRTAQYIEVKWATLTAKEALKIMDNLRKKSRKTGVVARKEYYTLIAKELKGQPSLEPNEEAIDLEDLSTRLNTTQTERT